MKPKTCKRCGETEGEALGSRFFLSPFEKPETAEDSEPIRLSGTPAPQNKDKREYLITGECEGFGVTDEWIKDSSVRIAVDTSEEGILKLQLKPVVYGSDPVTVLLAADKEGITLYLPETMEESYFVSYETIRSLTEEYTGGSGISIPQGSASGLPANMTPEDMTALFRKYGEILFSVATVHNTTEHLSFYELKALGEKPLCLSVTCKPDVNDWRTMLRELFSTAKTDEQLVELLEQSVQATLRNESTKEAYESMGITSVEDTGAWWQQTMDAALEQVDDFAQMLNGVSFELATGTGRVFAVKLFAPDGPGYGYESFGDPDDMRRDAVVLYNYTENGQVVDAKVAALNTLQQLGDTLKGKLSVNLPTELELSYVTVSKDDMRSFDSRLSVSDIVVSTAWQSTSETSDLTARYDSSSNGAKVRVTSSDLEHGLILLEMPAKTLETEEDFAEAMQNIVMCLGETDLAAKVSDVIALYMPETDGEPELPEETPVPVAMKLTEREFFDANGQIDGVNTEPDKVSLVVYDPNLAVDSIVFYEYYGGQYFGFIAEDGTVDWIIEPQMFDDVTEMITEIFLYYDSVVLDFYYNTESGWILDEQTFDPA